MVVFHTSLSEGIIWIHMWFLWHYCGWQPSTWNHLKIFCGFLMILRNIIFFNIQNNHQKSPKRRTQLLNRTASAEKASPPVPFFEDDFCVRDVSDRWRLVKCAPGPGLLMNQRFGVESLIIHIGSMYGIVYHHIVSTWLRDFVKGPMLGFIFQHHGAYGIVSSKKNESSSKA